MLPSRPKTWCECLFTFIKYHRDHFLFKFNVVFFFISVKLCNGMAINMAGQWIALVMCLNNEFLWFNLHKSIRCILQRIWTCTSLYFITLHKHHHHHHHRLNSDKSVRSDCSLYERDYVFLSLLWQKHSVQGFLSGRLQIKCRYYTVAIFFLFSLSMSLLGGVQRDVSRIYSILNGMQSIMF